MKRLTSVDNQEIKSVVKLKDAKERYAQDVFIAEGTRVITTLVESGMQLVALYATENMLVTAQQSAGDDVITLVADNVMNKMSQATTPSGMLGIFKMPAPPSPHALTPGLVLANIADPGNMGTLIRTCAAINITSIVVVEGVDPYHPKVVQASAGTLGFVKIFQWDWHELLEHKKNLKLCALVVSGGKKPANIDKKFALIVVGSEAHGIPEQWLADCDEHVTIPMPGKTESLNAAVAGSIAAYEVFGT